MKIKKFKNGNYTLKAEPDDYDGESLFIHALWAMQEKDCQLFGDEYCMSNFEMAIDLYDGYTDKLICFPYSLAEELKTGRSIRLHARELNEWDRMKYDELCRCGEL